jgi:hypothetical protein
MNAVRDCLSRSLVVIGALGLIAAVPAQERRDPPGFAAGYTAEITEAADGAQVVLTLRLRNNTAEDAIGATVTLQDSADPSVAYGSVERVDALAWRETEVAGTFIVDARETERWASGAGPRLRVRFSLPSNEERVYVMSAVPAAAAR